MGILQVGIGAAKSVLADQWREYFYCPSLEADVLVKKGETRKSKRGFNTKGSDNLITNGSIIAVNEGQCMIIVDQGAIVEVCAEAGEFVYDTSTEPSIFYGNLSTGMKESFKQFGRRVSMGGDTGKDQRVYFFNTKEIMGNRYGTANPVPFRVVDNNIGLDIDIAIRCHGEYAYRIVDPILFYKNVCGNVTDEFTRDLIDSQLKSELLTALQPAFSKISDMGIRYSSLPGHTTELSNALNEVLSESWGAKYGIEISTFGVNSVKAPEEDEKMIKELQRNAAFRNPNMAAAHLVGAQASAMQAAASNQNAGPMMAFAGMNMATNAGGMNAQDLFAMGQQQAQAQAQYQQAQPQMQPKAQTAGWTCSCGASGNTGKFCAECGSPKPAENNFWTCSCGAQNKGKFCSECGKKKPAGIPLYKCDKCGWEPEDPANPPKFCPECGDPFDENDIK
ncbi:MAG: SPFH domain-containing protein [Eubacteriales bacterium]|nr:SPFH domain-containing protein [Eubacteriales bacterium]